MGLITLEQQDNFPIFDLTDNNRIMSTQRLNDDRAYLTHAHFAQDAQAALHPIVNSALRILEINTSNEHRSLEAFSAGFFAIDAIVALLQKKINIQLDAHADAGKYPLTTTMPEFDLSDSFSAWQDSHFNTYMTIIETTPPEHRHPILCNARLIGAHTACLLTKVEPPRHLPETRLN